MVVFMFYLQLRKLSAGATPSTHHTAFSTQAPKPKFESHINTEVMPNPKLYTLALEEHQARQKEAERNERAPERPQPGTSASPPRATRVAPACASSVPAPPVLVVVILTRMRL